MPAEAPEAGRPDLRIATLVLATVLIAFPMGAAVEGAPTFRVSDTGADGPELNIGVASNGYIFVGGWGRLARSTDGGVTWTNPTIPGSVISADRVLIVDKDTDRVFVDDTTLGCTILQWSDNYGATWSTNAGACGGGVTDHQKIAVSKARTPTPLDGLLYPNLVWVCANGLSHTDCGVSRDGGLTFAPARPHGIGCAHHGAPHADAEGRLYIATAKCGLEVRRSVDDGLSWTETRLDPLRFPSEKDTPDVATTSDGTVYLFYVAQGWKPAFARSTNGGLTWQGPYAVPVPGLTSAVFPTIVAGDAGRIAISFYGTTDAAPGWDLNPGNAPASVRWHGYVAIVTDANAAAPTLAPVRVTDHPLQYGCLSKLGGCLNNIADYMDVDVGPDGRVHAVYVDGCPATCASAAQSTADDAVVAVQTGGPRLRS